MENNEKIGLPRLEDSPLIFRVYFGPQCGLKFLTC